MDKNILILVILVISSCNLNNKKIVKSNLYGYWFPTNQNWDTKLDTFYSLNNNIHTSKTNQFNFYYFSNNNSEKRWATITLEKEIDSFTIAVDEQIEILYKTDSFKINIISDSLIKINNKSYTKIKNIR